MLHLPLSCTPLAQEVLPAERTWWLLWTRAPHSCCSRPAHGLPQAVLSHVAAAWSATGWAAGS